MSHPSSSAVDQDKTTIFYGVNLVANWWRLMYGSWKCQPGDPHHTTQIHLGRRQPHWALALGRMHVSKSDELCPYETIQVKSKHPEEAVEGRRWFNRTGGCVQEARLIVDEHIWLICSYECDFKCKKNTLLKTAFYGVDKHGCPPYDYVAPYGSLSIIRGL